MMVATNIPLDKLNNPIFRVFFESNFSVGLPSVTTFRTKYLPLCYEEVMQSIKDCLKTGSLWISADCSKDSMGHEVANIIVGKLNRDEYSKPFLVAVSFLDKENAATMARLVNNTLHKLDPEFDCNRARLLLSDAAPYMVKAGKDLRTFFPHLMHLTCIARGLHLVCHCDSEVFPDVNWLIATMKMVFLKSPNRRAAYKECCLNLAYPPEPAMTR